MDTETGREYTRIGRGGLVCLGDGSAVSECYPIGNVSVNGLFIIGETQLTIGDEVYGEFRTSLGNIEFNARIKRIEDDGFGIQIYNMPMPSFMALVGEVLGGCDDKEMIKSEISESKEKITISGIEGDIHDKLNEDQ